MYILKVYKCLKMPDLSIKEESRINSVAVKCDDIVRKAKEEVNFLFYY